MRIKFELEKETKGAVRYTEVQANQLDEPIIGTLYIRKSGLGKLGYKSIPSSLMVAVEEALKP